jgi:hypothetical protein
MAGRTGATVAPEKVTDVDSWLAQYKLKRANIKMGDDGSLLVLDPSLLKDLSQAYAKPAKVIPHVRASDMIVTLATSQDDGLRAAAEAKRKTLDEVITSNVKAATETYTRLESELLEAVDSWRVANSVPTRTLAAQRVGKLSQDITSADTDLRSAQYPYRNSAGASYVDGKKTKFVTLPVLNTYSPVERVLPSIVKDMA